MDERHTNIPNKTDSESTPDKKLAQQKMPSMNDEDLSDNRKRGKWQTIYSTPDAKKAIKFERNFLLVTFFVSLAIIGLANSGLIQHSTTGLLSSNLSVEFGLSLTSFFTGAFGGTLFSIKWLYHSVAHGMWHEDRRLWRVLTPVLSGGLAWMIYIIISSGLFGFVDVLKFKTPSLVMAMGLITGYFSDSAIAKLAEVAHSVFGSTTKR